MRAVAAANERRADRRLERYRIKQQTKIAVAEAAGRSHTNEVKHRRELKKVIDRHGQTDARWLDYEIDVAKLLDFPLMTDMRNPLTMEFHKAQATGGSAAAGERRRSRRRPGGAAGVPRRRPRLRDRVRRRRGRGDPAAPQQLLRRGPAAHRAGAEPAEAGRTTTPRRRRSARAPTPAPGSNSTGSWCCPPLQGPASSARSPERSRRSVQAAPASGSRRAIRSSAASASSGMSCWGDAGMKVTSAADRDGDVEDHRDRRRPRRAGSPRWITASSRHADTLKGDQRPTTIALGKNPTRQTNCPVSSRTCSRSSSEYGVPGVGA